MDTQKLKKILIIGSAILLLLFIIILILLLSSRKKPVSAPTKNNENPKKISNNQTFNALPTQGNIKGNVKLNTITLTNEQKIETSNSIKKWLATMQNNKHAYYEATYCRENNTQSACSLGDLKYQAGIYGAWANYQAYKFSTNNLRLEMLRTDLKTYSDENIIPTIQNYFWNCKLMYDIWSDITFPQEDRDNALRICVRGLLEPNEYDEIKQLANQITNITEKDINEALNGKNMPYNMEAIQGNFIVYSANASDLVYKSKIYQQDSFKKEAELYFLKALYLYGSNKQELETKSGTLGIAALDLYLLTKNENYYKISKQIINDRSIRECNVLLDCIVDYMLSGQLYVYTDEENYKSLKNNYLAEILTKYMDNDAFAKHRNLGSLYIKNNDRLEYPVIENAIFSGIYQYEQK